MSDLVVIQMLHYTNMHFVHIYYIENMEYIGVEQELSSKKKLASWEIQKLLVLRYGENPNQDPHELKLMYPEKGHKILRNHPLIFDTTW